MLIALGGSCLCSHVSPRFVDRKSTLPATSAQTTFGPGALSVTVVGNGIDVAWLFWAAVGGAVTAELVRTGLGDARDSPVSHATRLAIPAAAMTMAMVGAS